MLSMTGYGRSHVSRDGRDLLMELKTVNHRFLDVSLRLPKPLAFLEEPLRARIGAGQLKRGHIDVAVVYQNKRPDANTIAIDRSLLLQCAAETCAIAEELGQASLSVAELIQLSGALSVTQADEDADAVTDLALVAYDEAMAQLQTMREREGLALAADLAQNLTLTERLVAQVAVRAPAVPKAYHERLNARLAEWNVPAVDPQRLAQEVAVLADKCAIDEELSRLRSHFSQFRECIAEPGEVGRRMDFLLQEMNREANTIGSKASDAEIAQYVVEIKCLLEKLREQVQNAV
ncbi:MAG TPA: YicC family protein [Candidatus Limiplasma sp.]|nr:YicC family protein [Candidatus Limiplasma sp.]